MVSMLCNTKEITGSLLFSQFLVRLSSSLASLQLIQVPSADAHVALVVVHALAEILHVGGTRRVFERRGRVLAGVETVVHGLGGGGVVLLGLLLLSRGAGTATKESADGVADG
jgi:hypothetical protein